MGCFVRCGKNGMGCFVRGDKNGMGCYVRGDKNSVGCFVRGGKSLWDVLSRDVLSGSLFTHLLLLLFELCVYGGGGDLCRVLVLSCGSWCPL